jgi:hypothetical protein
MAKTTKPTKQQVAQGKARAGGNKPVDVTNADLKKLANGVVIAVSLAAPGAAIRDAVLLAKAIKAGKLTKDTIRAAEVSKLQKAAQEKPYAKAYKGKQGVDSDTTIKVKGTPKQTPETGAKVVFKKVVEPGSPKLVKARATRSEARIKSADEAIKQNIKNRQGKLIRSTAAAVAGSTNLKPKKK